MIDSTLAVIRVADVKIVEPWSAGSFSPRLPKEYTFSRLNGLDKTRDSGLIIEVNALRKKAWESADYNLPRDNWIAESDFNPEITHLFVHESNKLVASARVSLHADLESLQDWEYYTPYRKHFLSPIASVTKVVVSPENQKQGIATYLHFQAIEHARMREAQCISCDVRKIEDDRMGIYDRLGYINLGNTGPQEGWPETWDWAVMIKSFTAPKRHFT